MSGNETRVAEVVETPAPRRGVRVAELGRVPQTINLNPGEVLTIRELVNRGYINGQGSVIYVNSRPVESLDEQVRDGDTVVSVRKIVGGCNLRR